MKKYDSYKPSGVDWIGEVPNGWNVMKLLYCLRQAICDGPHETPKQVEDGIPFISIDSLNDTKDIDFSVVSKFISEEDYQNYMKKAKLEKGDILFSKAATIGKTAIVGDEKFMVWSPLAILKNNPQKLNNNFLYHLVNCQRLITSIALSGSYNTQINVGMREMEKAYIPVPPLSEQTAIANYLDAKCAKIDNVVAIQQKRIELLKELKQSIITKAVTKGLDKNAKMKESGVEWIGEVPEGWEVKKLKYNCKINGRVGYKGYTTADLVGEGDGAYTIGGKHISKNILDLTDAEYISWSKYYESPEIMVKKGDILTAQRGSLGKVAIVKDDIGEATINPSLILINNIKCSNKFLYWFMVSNCMLTNIELLNTSTAVPMVSQNQIENIAIPVPSLSEQTAIAAYLDKKCAAIDRQIAKIEKQIELLKEYKQSVITECVTGKRKVC